MRYSKSTGGFYDAEIHGASIPSDSVEISNEEYDALLTGQSNGMAISSDADGYPCLAERPGVDPQIVVAQKLNQIRIAREVILNRLAGIALAANLGGDTATAQAYLAVRTGLLNITKDLPADIETAISSRYDALRAQCTPQMVSAFAQVDA